MFMRSTIANTKIRKMNGIILRATFLNTRSDSLIEMERNSAEMGRGWLSGTPHLRLLKRMEIIVQLIGGLVKQRPRFTASRASVIRPVMVNIGQSQLVRQPHQYARKWRDPKCLFLLGIESGEASTRLSKQDTSDQTANP